MKGVSEAIARQALRVASYKMPVKTAFRSIQQHKSIL